MAAAPSSFSLGILPCHAVYLLTFSASSYLYLILLMKKTMKAKKEKHQKETFKIRKTERYQPIFSNTLSRDTYFWGLDLREATRIRKYFMNVERIQNQQRIQFCDFHLQPSNARRIIKALSDKKLRVGWVKLGCFDGPFTMLKGSDKDHTYEFKSLNSINRWMDFGLYAHCLDNCNKLEGAKEGQQAGIQAGQCFLPFEFGIVAVDSNDTFVDGFVDHDSYSGTNEAMETDGKLMATEEEKDQSLEELACSEAKQLKFMTSILHDKEEAIAELEAAKSLYQHKLQESEEEFILKSKLVLAKQDAVNLAVQVEKLAKVVFQLETSHLVEDAELRVSAAKTEEAEEAAHRTEKQIEDATYSKIPSIVKKSKVAIEKALDVTEEAVEHVKRTMAYLINGVISFSEVASVHTENVKLKLQLKHTKQQVKASEQRAIKAEEALLDLQESSRKETDVEEKKKAVSKAYNNDLIKASKETVRCECDALQRSIKAAEDALKMWKQRAEIVESLLLKKRIQSEGDEDMARRIKAVSPKFPPRRTDEAEALTPKFRSSEFPKPDEVWSIPQEKPRERDGLIEKEIIQRKRKALEGALQGNTIRRQRSLKQTKIGQYACIFMHYLKSLENHASERYSLIVSNDYVFSSKLQAFNWESWKGQWYMELAHKAADISQCGVTAVWLPPPTESVSPEGYLPLDLYNLNSKYGSEQELRSCIEAMHSQDLLVMGDIVLNHRCAHRQSPNGVWNIFGGKLAWGPEAIVCNDPNFQGRGGPSTGELFHAAPNIDHTQSFVQRDIKEWLNWLRNDIGYDGWRLDFVRGFSGKFMKEYIQASKPVFSIGEYWDSLAYEDGNLSYNQDDHRQRIIDWINATEGTSAAFDMTTKGILHSALHNQYWRLIDCEGKPPGLLGWWPSRSATFLENHDTGSTQGHWPFPRDKLWQGYAYILTHPGTPVIFYDHLYDYGLYDIITGLIEARRRAGIHCRSSVKIYHARNEGYVAQVGDRLVMKLGHFDWNPFKEIGLMDGSWKMFIDRGQEYQVWLRQ
ncbi:myosin-3-like isoform X1 [Senna tora]|uniref:alpha-amylase n=1 Tax=Senna tora TaxID=362788 RepID=A0A834W3K1_9FABA|nr:myosin-3-like isoform X1 [Senna tora]